MATNEQISIVHVIHHLVIGGMENGVVNLINHLPRDRFRHTVVCVEDFSDFRARIVDPEVEVIALHRSKIGNWRMRWRLWRLLRHRAPQIVHSRNLSGLDALLPARLVGAKTVHSEHGFDVDNLHGRATRPALLRRLHSPLVHRYVAVSQDLSGLMSREWGIARRRIAQIYNGVDTERFRPALPRRHSLLPTELQGPDLFVVGAVGRVRPIKDQATLLRACAAVLKRMPQWRQRLRLVIVGDGPLLDHLKQLAVELEMAPLVWFAGARHDVAQCMQSFDLFVLPSLNEGISNTLLEAMATGIPLLASAVGGNLELMEEGVVGRTFLPGDHDSLASMIENYMSDAELCALHGAAARQRAQQRFSLQAMVAAYQRVYEAV